MSERGRLQVKCHGNIIWLKLLQLLDEHINKAEYGIGGKSVLRRQKSYSVKLTVEYAIAVNTK
jgi:hypothetical protein